MTDILGQILGPLLFDARHIVVVSDAEGCILWTDGHPEVLRAAERICFSPGFAWGEAAAGTNAVGTALAADRPLQVFSAEHFRSEVHGWQCSGAPVHDPDTGETLGAIDVTGSYETAHPHTLALVGLAAQLVEQQLRAEMFERDAGILRLFAEHTARHGGPAAALSQTGRVLASTPAGWAGDRFDFLALDKRSSVDALGDGILVRPTGGGRRIGSRNRSRAAEGRLSLLGHRRAELRTAFGTRRLSARHGEICASARSPPRRPGLPRARGAAVRRARPRDGDPRRASPAAHRPRTPPGRAPVPAGGGPVRSGRCAERRRPAGRPAARLRGVRHRRRADGRIDKPYEDAALITAIGAPARG